MIWVKGRAPMSSGGGSERGEEASLEDSPHPPGVFGTAATCPLVFVQYLGPRRRPCRSLARGRPRTPEGGETGEPSGVQDNEYDVGE